MPLDVDRFQKPVRKLRKLLNKMSGRPTPDEVHDFRTKTRRVEASVVALSLGSMRNGPRLLKDLARVRKRAGKVRDMDVLTSFASTVHPKDENDCAVQLLEHFGAQRKTFAKRMYSEVRQKKKLGDGDARRQKGPIVGRTFSTATPDYNNYANPAD